LLNDVLWGVHRSGFESRFGFLRDRSWQEILSQGRFQIGNEFLEDAVRRLDRRFDHGRLIRDELSVERSRSFFLRDWSRWLGSNFFDGNRLFRSNRGNVIHGEFRDRIVRGQLLRCGSVL
jgi:hypothetical protein